MRGNGLSPKRKQKFKKTTDSQHNKAVASNLLDQNFSAEAPNEKWAADISYIWTAQGWLYLAVMLDLYSRRVIGWRHEHLPQTKVPFANVILHDRLLAREAMFVTKTLEDPLRRVPLLAVNRAILFQNAVDWTHPGKVEAPYTVCIASASNLTGLVKSSVECRRTGL